MGDYTILIQNKSGASRAYFLFMKQPEISAVQSKAVFRNVLLASRPVADKTGTASFAINRQYYAVTGSASKPLAPGLNVNTGDFELVVVARGDTKGSGTYMTVDDEGIHFQPAKITSSVTQPGSFSIQTDKSFHFPNSENIFIGLGCENPQDPTHIIPVATVLAQPNTKNIIRPWNTFYVSWGTFTSGDIIDVSTLAEPVEINFETTSSTKAKVVHKDDGSWETSWN